mgnify:CR=1 FL=1
MKPFADFISILLFFAVYYAVGKSAHPEWALYAATGVSMLTTLVQAIHAKISTGRISGMLKFNLAVILIMGGLTLIFHNPDFIKYKPTVLYWGFASVLIGSQLFWRKNLIKQMGETKILLPDFIWPRLNYAWIIFFICMGLVNIWVAHTYEEATWVKFKLFGASGIMAVFMFAQMLLLQKHITLPEEKSNPIETKT